MAECLASLYALEHPVTTELAVRSKPIIDMAAEFRTQEILLQNSHPSETLR